ncbi:outer membrane protein assembly factor BamE [bacterium]|jgi:outer membrane protein assembly factor BamE (lipoprotein component of BamABCDE complex)|nr:outer membrane protein assembly factor BamE [bacterium]NBX72311.1 outer membrane protein assembly factor BamE [bacterium]
MKIFPIPTFLILFFTGCTTFHSYSYQLGPMIDNTTLQSLQKGMSRDEIISLFGAPSFQCINPTHTKNICYFHQVRHHDSIIEQRYVEIFFDHNDLITDIEIHDTP